MNTTPHQRTANFVTSTGMRMFYRDFSPADAAPLIPMICLHGFLRNSRDFVAFGEHMAQAGVRVIAPDLRGRGFSEWTPDTSKYGYADTKQDVVDLLNHLGLERVAILGIALGAIIALDLVKDLGARVSGVVLNDQGAEVGEAAASKMASNVEAADYTFEEALARMKEHFAATYPDLADDRWVDLTLRAYRELKPGRFARDLDMGSLSDIPRMKAERSDLWKPFLDTKGTPVAILRGELSYFFPADCADKMVELHPDAWLTTIENVGHPPLLEEDLSLKTIFELLKKVS